MDCSVIITFFSNLVHLETSIYHAKKALSKFEGEIIVVNDNPSIEIPEDISIGTKVINLENNYGYSIACNLGVEEAFGSYLFFQDSDVFVEENCIEKLFQSEAKIKQGAVSASILRSSDSKIHHFGIAFIETDVLKPYRGRDKFSTLKGPLEFQALTSDSMLVKKKLFLKCGGFEPKLKNSYCDLDFGLKVKQNGGVNVVDPEAISYHRSRGSGVNRTKGEEDNKCAFFKYWGQSINNDFIRLFDNSLTNEIVTDLSSNTFMAFNFSSSTYIPIYKKDIETIASQKFDWIEVNTNSGLDKIRLEDYLSWSLISSPRRFLFFVDSMDQLVHNDFLINNRPCKKDICIDRNANIFYFKET